MRIGLLMADDGYDWDEVARQLDGLDWERWPDCRDWDETELVARSRSVDAIVTGRRSPALPEALIEDRGSLRLLAHSHGTVKHLVTQAHLEAGLLVSNWGDGSGAGVAEAAVLLTMACLKQLQATQQFIANDWNRETDPRIHHSFPATLAGRPVGIYGYGPIGSKYAAMVQVYGAEVAIYDPFATDVPDSIRVCADLDELFRTCDVISVHCGLNDATRGSVNAERLAMLPQGGVVVNTARGPVIDEDALVAEVQAGRLRVGLDVVCQENRWAQHPLQGHPQAILTGHLAAGNGKGPPPEEKKKPGLTGHVVNNLRALAEGRALENLIAVERFAIKT